MKKIVTFSLLCLFAVSLFSCAKEKETTSQKTSTNSYVVDLQGSSVQWTAYKTTEKLPVKGTFKEISILKSNKNSTASGALNGLEFEIPVSSIFSNDTIRDAKLNKFFFAVMKNTTSLKGTFSIGSQDKGKLNLTMNGLTKEIPFKYTMSQDTILIEAQMRLNNWAVQAALESLHKACEELHTGPDGISKTWDEVAINAKLVTRKKS